MIINQAGIALAKKFEDFREYAYPDPASELYRETVGMKLGWGKKPASEIMKELPAEYQDMSAKPWTVGYGFTRGVDAETRMTEAAAAIRLQEELGEIGVMVSGVCSVPANQNQLAAMSVLAFNIGQAAFRKSTVLRAHNAGDHQAAARAFALWNKAGGRVMAGLERRRRAESVLYLEPVEQHTEPVMPQTVDEERPMTASRINQASTIAGGTAALATVAETARTLTDIRQSAMNLGDWLLPILLVGIVALCGYIVWQRVLQRRGGWA